MDVLAAIDIGNNKVTCIIFEVNKKQEIKVLSWACQLSEGIRRGVIIDMPQLVVCIQKAIRFAEDEAKVIVRQTFVCVNSVDLTLSTTIATLPLSYGAVTENDIKQAIKIALPNELPNILCLHSIPMEFEVDDLGHIKDPIGIVGKQITCYMQNIFVPSNVVQNLMACCEALSIQVIGVVAAPLSSSLTVMQGNLGHEDFHLLEIGSCYSSLISIKNASPTFIKTIGFGSYHVTQDIASLGVSIEAANKLKLTWGELSPQQLQDEFILVEDKEISLAAVNYAISARIREIVQMLLPIDFNTKQPLFLSGGGMLLRGMEHYLRVLTEQQVHLVSSVRSNLSCTPSDLLLLSCCYGIVEYVAHYRNFTIDKAIEKSNWFSNLFNWIKNWYR